MVNFCEITDFHTPELDVYARLTEAQLHHCFEPNGGLFIAESPKVIDRALAAGYKPVSLLAERSRCRGEALEVMEKCGDVPVYIADESVLCELTGFHLTRGMLCAMHRPPLLSPEALLQNACRVAVLEDVMNPTNLGAIFRSAAALGMDAVLLSPGCTDPLYRRCVRVSMGTVFQIPWAPVPEDYVNLLHREGFRAAAMALRDNTLSVDDPTLRRESKLAVVLGTEGEGLRQETIDACDYAVRIPMAHGVDSLNVAAASAVAFWALRK